jgi:cell division septum initiation protein DivIVA
MSEPSKLYHQALTANRQLLAENARLKAEVERLTAIVGADAIDREHGMCCDASAQVERLTADNEQLQNRCDFLEGKGL